MIDQDIEEILEKTLNKYQLQVQVLQQDQSISVILNRCSNRYLNYSNLTKIIQDQVQNLGLSQIETLVIYSRPLGEHEADWQVEVVITSVASDMQNMPKYEFPVDELETFLQTSNQIFSENAEDYQNFFAEKLEPIADQDLSEQIPQKTPISPQITEQQPKEEEVEVAEESIEEVSDRLDLSQYIFARNVHLVKTTLPDPDAAIALAVDFFHNLPDLDKRKLAPILVDFFKSPDKASIPPQSENLEEWLNGIKKLGDREFKSVSVWLSRYCRDPIKTLEQVNNTLSTIEAIAKQEAYQKEIEEEEAKNELNAIQKLDSDQKLTQSKQAVLTKSLPKSEAKSQTNPNSQLESVWKIFTAKYSNRILRVLIILPIIWLMRSCYSTLTTTNDPCGSFSGIGDKQLSVEYCKLGSQMIGGDSNLFGLTVDAEAIYNVEPILEKCLTEASNKAGVTNNQLIVPEIFSFPLDGFKFNSGVYVVDYSIIEVSQNDSTPPKNLGRYACLIRNSKSNGIELFKVDTIPQNWPTDKYVSK